MTYPNDIGASAPLQNPVDSLPRLFRIEQRLAETIARVDEGHADLIGDLAAAGTLPAVLLELHRRHAKQRGELVEVQLAIRAIRHELSKVLP